jgi:hypothetical protein
VIRHNNQRLRWFVYNSSDDPDLYKIYLPLLVLLMEDIYIVMD